MPESAPNPSDTTSLWGLRVVTLVLSLAAVVPVWNTVEHVSHVANAPEVSAAVGNLSTEQQQRLDAWVGDERGSAISAGAESLGAITLALVFAGITRKESRQVEAAKTADPSKAKI